MELRPIVSSSAPRTTQPRPASPRPGGTRGGGSAPRSARAGGVVVRRVARGADDGYRNSLVIGLKSGEDAGRLAEELAFADYRCRRLEHDPPGLYAEVASVGGDVEERTWLAFLIAYLCPLEGEAPFSEIERVRTTWASGEMPDLDDVQTGPRTAHDPSRGTRTLEAYRIWATRAGSQAAAFTGDDAWTPERRFARAYERLALPGLHRDARFDLLVTLGRLGVYDMQAASLALGGGERCHRGGKAGVRNRRSAVARAPGRRPRSGVRALARAARPRAAQLAARRARHARTGCGARPRARFAGLDPSGAPFVKTS